MPPRGGTNPSEVPLVLSSEKGDARNNVSPPEEGSAGLVLSSFPSSLVKRGRWRVLGKPLVPDLEAVTCLPVAVVKGLL